MPGSFDRLREHDLMSLAGSRKTSGQNFATLRNEHLQEADILVIDIIDFVLAKLAYPSPADREPFLCPAGFPIL